MKKLFSFCAAMFAVLALNAAVINIDNTTANSLQAALNSATSGDEIVMAAGTYAESGNYLAFTGKDLTVKAAEGAEVIIQTVCPVRLKEGAKAEFVNVKFDCSTIGDYEYVIVAADDTDNKRVVLTGCEFYGWNKNKAMIEATSSRRLASVTINNCYFHNCMKSVVFIENTGSIALSITNSTFANIATDASGFWAGVIDSRATAGSLLVDHCTFYNVLPMNTDYAAIGKNSTPGAVVSNSIFMLPAAQDNVRAIRDVASATNCITYNYLKDSGTGIHSSVTKTNCQQVDPLFVNAAEGNFTLGEGSPALTMNDGQPIGDPRWVPAPAAPKTIYCKVKQSWWTDNNAAVGVYAWGEGVEANAAWPGVRMAKVEGQPGVWSIELDAKYTSVAFTRLNPSDVGDLYWGAKTEDQVVPTDDNDLFTITSETAQWDGEGNKAKGIWSKYVPETPAKFYITGIDDNWAPDAIKSTEDSYVLHLAAGDYAMKITVDGTWGTVKGFTDLTETAAGLSTIDDGYNNIHFTLEAAGDVTVTYTGTVFKLEGNFKTTPTALENTNAAVKTVKMIENGQMIIIKNGVKFNAQGAIVR